MKRILLSVFAVAITAAWAVPATAGDVTFSGQYRLRGEYLNNADYDDNVDDADDFWTQRVRLTANANATDDTSVKITIQDTRTFGDTGLLSDNLSNAGNADPADFTNSSYGGLFVNTLDLHEAYVNVNNIFGAPLALRAGRQELNYGDQRLIGAFGWSNNGRAFDGFKAMYSNDMVDVDAFTMTLIEDRIAGAFTSGLNDDVSFSGVYATIKQLVPDNTVDLYLLNLNDNADYKLYTIGFRVAGAMSGVDYTLELPYQFGEATATSDIDAWAVALKVGYTLPTPMKIRIGAEYDYGTGDDVATADAEGFVNLFPTNHGHFGISDIINSWTNTQAWSINASADVTEQINLYAAYWNFKANEVTAPASDELGSEIDLVAKYKYSNNVGLEAGYSRFFSDDGTPGVAPAKDDADFAYLQLTANF